MAYRKALERNSRNPQAAYNLGNALMAQQKDSAAIEQFQIAAKLETNPLRKAKSYHNLGVICQKHKYFTDAIEQYKEALRLNPNDDMTRYNLALCKRMQNSPENKNNQQNKDDNKNNDDKDKQDKQKQDEQKNDDKKNENNNNKQEDNKDKMSKDNAEQLLNAAMQQEKNTQQRMNKAMQQPVHVSYRKIGDYEEIICRIDTMCGHVCRERTEVCC